ncbi:MAG: penicillin-binding transpeptidase domain-containing protein [Lachnospiraceae bacterium]
MFKAIKEFFSQNLKSRLLIVIAIMALFSGILICRLFNLQIINGEDFLNNFTLKIKKEITINSTRGNIFDADGNVLAYNELAYNVNIEDNGTYPNTRVKNRELNAEIQKVLDILDKNGDSIDNDFGVTLNADHTYSFNVEGSSLKRFLADVYGKTSYSKLIYDEELGYNPANASAEQVMQYLYDRYQIYLFKNDKTAQQVLQLFYDKKDLKKTAIRNIENQYRIAVIRYKISQNGYQKYIATTIASDVSEETVAVISENLDSLQGVSIEDDTSRAYVDSKYFSHLIGYTGTMSDADYQKLSKKNKNYSLNDTVGKSGIEQYMDEKLQGTKGSETVYVDNLGKVIETTSYKEANPGNDVYLSIRKDLQEAVYDLLEQEIAGIVYSKIENIKEFDASEAASAADIVIPIYDVYFALLNNNVIDISHFAAEDASENERAVYQAFQSSQQNALTQVSNELNSQAPTSFGELPKETQAYLSYIATMLSNHQILLTNKIDATDEKCQAWKADAISLSEYLKYAIDKDWIDVTQFASDSKYSDSSEVYERLVAYIMDELKTDTDFSKKVYKYMIKNDTIQGSQLCLILFDQNVLKSDAEAYAGLSNGSISAFTFLKDKIKNIEITPAQLALDPCTGSCVITSVKTGETLACVTYPGYDNNRLANKVDSQYYNSLQKDLSLPLYNYATQQRTAPGSTFKLLSATAGLAEGAISTTETIDCEGKYTKVDNEPKCWIYPSSHGSLNVSGAIQNSCNYFFYEVGYRLSTVGNTFSDPAGIEKIQKYAKLYGLGDKTGIEVEENTPQIADEYPVMAAIGQSNNSYTTTEIGRYVNAVANSGTVYNLTLLKKVDSPEGKTIETYAPTVKNKIDVLNDQQWNAIHEGMAKVVEDLECFKGFQIKVAGKTGTAQQVSTRPNHALFVGYAPYDNPEIAVATRIAYGYSSHNAAAATKEILSYYFKQESEKDLLNGMANDVDSSSNSFTD